MRSAPRAPTLRYQRSSAAARRPRRRARAARARPRSSRRSCARPRRCAAGSRSPPCQATPGRASPSTAGCWRASARSSQGVSVSSALSICPAPDAGGDDELGPAPGTSTMRTRRARDECRTRTFTVPAAQEHRALALHGRQTTRRAGGADHGAAGRSRGGPVLARAQRRARLGRHARRARARDVARRRVRRRSIDIPGPVAAIVRPRAAGGIVVATETGVVLLDEHDSPTPLCEILERARHPHERRRLRSAGALLVRDDGLRRTRTGAGSLYRVEPDGSFATALDRRHDLERARLVGRRRDGVLRRYADAAHRHVRVRRRDRRAQRAAALRRDRPGPRGARRAHDRRRGRRVGRALGGRRRAPLRARRHARRGRLAALRSRHGLRVRRRRPRRALHHDLARGTARPARTRPAARCSAAGPACAGRPVRTFAG